MSRLTIEQVTMLARIERDHGRVRRVPDDHPMAEEMLSNAVTGTCVFRCEECKGAFCIEPDGDTDVYAWVRS